MKASAGSNPVNAALKARIINLKFKIMIKKYKKSLINMPAKDKPVAFMLAIMAYFSLPLLIMVEIGCAKGFLEGLLLTAFPIFGWILAIITATTLYENPL